MDFNFTETLQTGTTILMTVGLKLLGALALWIIGRRVIGIGLRLLSAALERQHFDITLARYIRSATEVALVVALVVAILGYLGVETTTFAALIAAGGVAIGMAWSGLLAHFAAGVFMVALRPFKVGDYVNAGTVEGTVEEIGLFVTAISTPDNIRTIIGNSRVFSENIRNFSHNPFRRVDRTAQLDHSVDVNQAIALLKARLGQIPNVLPTPAPDVELLDFTLAGPVLAVRPYCHTDHYWQVYFDTNKVIREEFGKAAFPVPEQHLHVRQG